MLFKLLLSIWYTTPYNNWQYGYHPIRIGVYAVTLFYMLPFGDSLWWWMWHQNFDDFHQAYIAARANLGFKIQLLPADSLPYETSWCFLLEPTPWDSGILSRNTFNSFAFLGEERISLCRIFTSVWEKYPNKTEAKIHWPQELSVSVSSIHDSICNERYPFHCQPLKAYIADG